MVQVGDCAGGARVYVFIWGQGTLQVLPLGDIKGCKWLARGSKGARGGPRVKGKGDTPRGVD